MKKHYKLFIPFAALLILLASCGQTTLSSTPEKVGLSSDTLELASQKMQEYIDNGKLAGIATLVMKDGKIVHRERFGFANIEEQKPKAHLLLEKYFSD